MAAFYEIVESIFKIIVQFGILLMEGVGVTVLVITAVKCVAGCFKHSEHVRLELA